MSQYDHEKDVLFTVTVGLAAWCVPGAGYYLLKDRKRGILVCVTVVLTFLIGLSVGSIGVIDKIDAKPWYVAQVMNSPAVMLIGNHVAQASDRAKHSQTERRPIQATPYRVFGRQAEIGQIYTSISGLLNLLCVVNAVYIAHRRPPPHHGD
ncbi:MAG: hypothetical protein IIA65_04835 [Planctomycetes bacterium]|nr:hypothetical protein [Planctomycetota bacterium]